MGSDSNLMPLGIFQILFPKVKIEKLANNKDKRVILQKYYKTKIMQ